MRSPLEGQNPNTLSARVTLPPFTVRPSAAFGEGPDTPILQMQGEDDDARTLVIAFQPVFTGTASAGRPHPFPLQHGPCVATVEWGTGSQTLFAEIDVAKGTAITVAASTVRLTARNDGRAILAPEGFDEFGAPQPALSIDPNPAPQEVVGMVGGAGLRGGSACPTRTYHGARLRVPDGLAFPVPPFARRVRIGRSPLSTSVGLTVTAGFGAATIKSGEIILAPGDEGAFLPLFDLADNVLVRNVGPGAVDFFHVQFELGGL